MNQTSTNTLIALVDKDGNRYEACNSTGFVKGDLISEELPMNSDEDESEFSEKLVSINMIHSFKEDQLPNRTNHAFVYFEREIHTIQGVGEGTKRFKVKLIKN